MHLGSQEKEVQARVQPLKKVAVSLLAGDAPGKFNLRGSPATLEFVCGVAADGLCPLEAALLDKHAGETLSIVVRTADAHEFFGHIYRSLLHVLGLQIMPETICLKIEITTVTDADNREVVQSVARALAHGGCGGSCGCGC